MGEFAPLAIIVVGIVTVLGLATAYFTCQNLGIPGSVGVLAVLLVALTIAALIMWGKISARAAKNRAVQNDARDWASWVVTFPNEVQETVKILSSPWDASKKWSAVGLGRLPDPMKGDPGEWPELVPSRNAEPALADRGIWSVPVGLRMRLAMTDGQERKHYEAQLGRLAVALNADSVRIVATQKRFICLDVRYFDPLLYPVPVPKPVEPVDLNALNPGLRDDGEQWLVPLQERNRLGVGVPGSGKSGFVRADLVATAPAARDGLVINIMIDLKFGIEAAKLRGLLHRTATSEDTSLALLQWLRYIAIEGRGREMEALGLDKHVPTPGAPLVHLIIDEIAELLDNPKTRREFLRVLISIGRLGRALGFSISAYTQLADKKILDMLRDLFQIRIGMRLTSPEQMVMVYGDHHAHDRGADNTRIPDQGAQGMAYVVDDSSAQIVRVRAYQVTPENLQWFAQQYPPAPHTEFFASLDELGSGSVDARPAVDTSAATDTAAMAPRAPRYQGDGLPEVPDMAPIPSMFAEIDAEADALDAKLGEAIAGLDPAQWPVGRPRSSKGATDDGAATVFPLADRRKRHIADVPPQEPVDDDEDQGDDSWDDWNEDADDSGDESA